MTHTPSSTRSRLLLLHSPLIQIHKNIPTSTLVSDKSPSLSTISDICKNAEWDNATHLSLFLRPIRFEKRNIVDGDEEHDLKMDNPSGKGPPEEAETALNEKNDVREKPPTDDKDNQENDPLMQKRQKFEPVMRTGEENTPPGDERVTPSGDDVASAPDLEPLLLEEEGEAAEASVLEGEISKVESSTTITPRETPSAPPSQQEQDHVRESALIEESTASSISVSSHSSPLRTTLVRLELDPLIIALERDDQNDDSQLQFSSKDIIQLHEQCDEIVVDIWQCLPTQSPFKFRNKPLLKGCVIRLQKIVSHDHCIVLWKFDSVLDVRLSLQMVPHEDPNSKSQDLPPLGVIETSTHPTAGSSHHKECTVETSGQGIQEDLFWLMAQQMDGAGSMRAHFLHLRDILSKPIQGYHATTETIPEDYPSYEDDDTLLDKLYKSIHSLFTFMSTYQEEVPLSVSYQRMLRDFVQRHIFIPIRIMILDGLLPPPQIGMDANDNTDIDVHLTFESKPNLKAWKYLQESITQILAGRHHLTERIEQSPEEERFFAFMECALMERQLADWMNALIQKTAKRNLEGLLSYQRFGNMARVNNFLRMCRTIDNMSFHFVH